jgi:hypothetical protein
MVTHGLIHRVTLQIGGVGHVDLEALGLAVLRNSNMFRWIKINKDGNIDVNIVTIK